MTQASESAQSTELDNLTRSNEPTLEDSEFPSVGVSSVQDRHQSSGKSKKLLIILIVLFSIACLGIGIALVIKANAKCKKTNAETESNLLTSKACAPSQEAKRVKLFEFFRNVQRTFFELHPNTISLDTLASSEKMKKTYKAYDSRPEAIKNRTDSANRLLNDIASMDTQVSKLKPREKKLLSQMKFYLKHIFGQPYDGDYYSGGWMMGPNFFCWQPMCSLGQEVGWHLPLFAPKTIEDIQQLERVFQGYNNTIYQYIENLKLGIQAGMVRSVEECKAGLNSFSGVYREIYFSNGTGVLKESFVKIITQPEFYSKLSNDTKKLLDQSGKTAEETIKKFIVDNFGIPMKQLLSFLEKEYSRHCVPSNVSSGLSNRPLSYVYVDGVATKPTTKKLPTGETLNGTNTYASIMSYFTTTDITPKEVYDKGWEMLKKTYPQAVAVAKQVTGINDTDKAVAQFRAKLKSQSMYFNDAPLPKNESGPDAHMKCSSVEGAKKYCPVRWRTLQKWFKSSREVMSLLDPKTIDMFYFTGQKHTTPNCPISLAPDFNPSSAAQSYINSDPNCTKPCTYNVPFFLTNMGPSFSEWSVNAHEARPGHHTQSQGYQEHFRDTCGGIGTWLNQVVRFDAFSEGWGLYAESVIGEDTDTYEGKPLMKYGWLKWQVVRALRLVIDAGLHSRGLTRQEALDLFDKYAWDDSDVPQKELTRYQSGPGQATAYMIGQLTIIRLRRYATDKLGKKFDLKDFHFQVLSQGTAPLSFLINHIEHYVKCKLNPDESGCEFILSSPPPSSQHSSYVRTLEGITVHLPHFPFRSRGYL